ncbi:hypothetical protein LTR60_007488, partial [Cryomyces antarcticus]
LGYYIRRHRISPRHKRAHVLHRGDLDDVGVRQRVPSLGRVQQRQRRLSPRHLHDLRSRRHVWLVPAARGRVHRRRHRRLPDLRSRPALRRLPHPDSASEAGPRRLGPHHHRRLRHGPGLHDSRVARHLRLRPRRLLRHLPEQVHQARQQPHPHARHGRLVQHDNRLRAAAAHLRRPHRHRRAVLHRRHRRLRRFHHAHLHPRLLRRTPLPAWPVEPGQAQHAHRRDRVGLCRPHGAHPLPAQRHRRRPRTRPHELDLSGLRRADADRRRLVVRLRAQVVQGPQGQCGAHDARPRPGHRGHGGQ